MPPEDRSQDDVETSDELDRGAPAYVSPRPIYTSFLIACIAVVFVVQFLTSKDPEFLAIDRWSGMVAGFDKHAFLAGEHWRILTGASLHSGFLHVVMNCYAFYSFGRLFEMLSNRAHLSIVFVLSAIGGGLLSLVANPDIPSVGASGGIVGLLGYLTVYAFKRRQFISPEFRKSLLVNIGIILVFGLILFQRIDNFGHIGGLLTGTVYAFIQIPTDAYTDPRTAGPMSRLLGYLSLGLYFLAAAFTVLLLVTAS